MAREDVVFIAVRSGANGPIYDFMIIEFSRGGRLSTGLGGRNHKTLMPMVSIAAGQQDFHVQVMR